MMDAASETRRRPILLPPATTEEERQRLQQCLLELEAVDGVEIDGPQCRITYAFPDITFAHILSRLREEIREPLPFIDRLRYDLIAVMENNERDYRLQPCGWHYYLQHIHARRFDLRHSGSRDNRKQQWQQYTGRRHGTAENAGTVQSNS